MRRLHGKASLPTAEAWFDVARMHAGTRSPWVAAGIIDGDNELVDELTKQALASGKEKPIR